MRVREGAELVGSASGRRWLRRTAAQRIYSRRESICLRRDLTIPFEPPLAKISFELRHLRADDNLSMIADDPSLPPKIAQLRADQRWLMTTGLPTPWVAIDPEGDICFMVWSLTARDNPIIQKVWGKWLPILKPDESLIEGIYAAESHRGLGIMPDAATKVAETAMEHGARWGLGFIGSGNTSSLRGGEKAGWIPYIRREEKYTLFRRTVDFSLIDESVQ